MYRIRLASGEEAVYRSAEELAVAVSSGVVSPTAEVFHNSASRWLPIDLHPDYRAVATGKRPALLRPAEDGVPPIPVDLLDSLPPIPPPPQANGPSGPSATGGPGGHPFEASPVVVEEYDPGKDPTPIEIVQSSSSVATVSWSSRTRKLRLILALAMGVGAIGLVVGGAVTVWRHLLPLLEQKRTSPPLSEGMSPQPLPMRRVDSSPTVYPAPAPPLPIAAGRAARDSSAPDIHTSRLETTRHRTPGYFEAYADARAEMDEAFDYIHFQQVFAPSRLATPESLRATRRMVAAAANILRVYRGREVMLEQTFRPDDPGGRGSFREPFETAEAARSLLADTDSLFAVLIAQQGRLSYNGQSVSFKDPKAGAVYSELRLGILTRLDEWRDWADGPDLLTIPRIARALGNPPPPTRR